MRKVWETFCNLQSKLIAILEFAQNKSTFEIAEKKDLKFAVRHQQLSKICLELPKNNQEKISNELTRLFISKIAVIPLSNRNNTDFQ